MKIKITKEMLKEQGKKVLGTTRTTDEQINFYGWGNTQKPLKIVAVKGYIDDWAIYVESMDRNMTYDGVRYYGNKIHSKETIKLLVNCDKKILSKYRF